ncbi:MAG: hypothetical protein BGO01_04660 [Armatimonadetes bacterium 55-13]|nr:hypothetical protein [Armatimonadota bacterium]OJU61386.1 MAG: hypothetical protein BGO01_04660 [Armatimonadetes bacterium 55-13]
MPYNLIAVLIVVLVGGGISLFTRAADIKFQRALNQRLEEWGLARGLKMQDHPDPNPMYNVNVVSGYKGEELAPFADNPLVAENTAFNMLVGQIEGRRVRAFQIRETKYKARSHYYLYYSCVAIQMTTLIPAFSIQSADSAVGGPPETGDPLFDRTFVIRGERGNPTQEMLTAEVRANALRAPGIRWFSQGGYLLAIVDGLLSNDEFDRLYQEVDRMTDLLATARSRPAQSSISLS